MLNENLSRVRREKGLTQEALAVKLNVVRQTISKWENGSAVPDADTLCKIAEVLEVPVAQLLGESRAEEKIDVELMARTLAEINEQLAVRNRRSGKILKAVLVFIFLLFIIKVGFVFALGILPYSSVTSNATVNNTEDIVELDESEFPVLNQFNKENLYLLRDYLNTEKVSADSIAVLWGDPFEKTENSMLWKMADGNVIEIFFNEESYASDCTIR